MAANGAATTATTAAPDDSAGFAAKAATEAAKAAAAAADIAQAAAEAAEASAHAAAALRATATTSRATAVPRTAPPVRGPARRLWLSPVSAAWTPFLALLAGLAVYVLAERGFGVPMPGDPCPLPQTAIDLAPQGEGPSVRLTVGLPRADAEAADRLSFPACSAALARHNEANRPLPAEPRARALVALNFAVAALVALVLAGYALATVYGVRTGLAASPSWPAFWASALVPLAVGAGLAWFAVVGSGWIPHAATRETLDLLRHVAKGGADSAALAWRIAVLGAALLVLVVVLHVTALTYLALPVVRSSDADAHESGVDDELARRFERLTTLSYAASLAFAFAVLTFTALLQWPLAVPGIGPGVGHAASAMTALFGAYLTAVLTGAFLPTAARLEFQAEQAARLAHPADLAARRKWLADRGLTVFSTTRLGAALATLLPLLAGSAAGLPGLATALGPALRP